MPYVNLYLSKKTRRHLKRLSKIYGFSDRALVLRMLNEYYNLMRMLEVEVSDSYSERMYARSQKKPLGAFPLFDLSEKANSRLEKYAQKADQGKTRFLTRLIAMGVNELEDDLLDEQALADFLKEKNLTKKQFNKGHPDAAGFHDYLFEYPGNMWGRYGMEMREKKPSVWKRFGKKE